MPGGALTDLVPTATAPRANQREHILDVALQLMSERGSSGMSMRQLAQACGVQVAAIYHYFPSKDELLRSVVEERRYSARLVELPVGLDRDAPIETRLRAIYLVFWEGALEEEPVLRLLLGEGLRSQPAALPTGAALLEVFRSGVTDLIEAVAPELQPHDLVAQVVVSQVFSGFIRHIFEPDVAVERIADDQVAVLLGTLLGAGSARS
jgi:AcrR family transcriptional regulator